MDGWDGNRGDEVLISIVWPFPVEELMRLILNLRLGETRNRTRIGRESDENLIESDVDSTSVVVVVAAWATYLASCVDPFVVIDTEYEYPKVNTN